MLVDLWTDDDNVLAEKEKKRTSFEPAKGLLLQSKYRSRDFPGSRCPVIVLVSKKRATGSRTMDSLVVQRLCYSLQRMYNVRRKKGGKRFMRSDLLAGFVSKVFQGCGSWTSCLLERSMRCGLFLRSIWLFFLS